MFNLKVLSRKMGVKSLYECGYVAVDKILQNICVIPQSYSFMSFVSHGVGMHAYLYYLSLCDGIYPQPWYLTSATKYWFGERGESISLRFLLFYLKNRQKFKNNVWGLTFDGSMQNSTWAQINCGLCVPAITIVRDPVAIITTLLNMGIWYSVVCNLALEPDFEKVEKNNLTRLELFVNFKSSMKPFRGKMSSINYFDTKEFIGDQAQNTMMKIGEIIGASVPQNHFFGKSINNPFKRCFPKIYQIDSVNFRVSPFPDQFSLHVHELVYKKPYEHIWEIYYPELFPDEVLYITSSSMHVTAKTRESFFDALHADLDVLYRKISMYEQHKIGNEEVIDFLNKSTYNSQVKKTFEYEVSDLVQERKDIVDSWKYFHQFMGK